MTETPIYARALTLFRELDELVETDRLQLTGTLQVELVNTRALVGATLAVAEALHARDTLTGSSDE